VNFLQDIKRYRCSIGFLKEKIGKEKCIFLNLDQTPVFYDMSGRYTYEEVGAKEIAIRKTTGDKMRLTFMLCVSSDGQRYPPYVIIKSKSKEIFNKFEEISILRGNSNGI
jgi:hypothetical protein